MDIFGNNNYRRIGEGRTLTDGQLWSWLVSYTLS